MFQHKSWEDRLAGEGCPLCHPRPDSNDVWKIVQRMEVSTLYLQRNQAYRGHCILVFDRGHVSTMEGLSQEEYEAYCRDLRASANAIVKAVQPDHFNYEILGNVVPHLHWHLIPRFKDDPRWGSATWTTTPGEMISRTLSEEEFDGLIMLIEQKLQSNAPSTG